MCYHTAFHAARGIGSFLGSKYTFLVMPSFSPPILQSLLLRAAFNPLIGQPLSVFGIALTQVQDLTFDLGIHEVCMGLPL